VVPFAAGGSNDVIARVIGARLQKSFGQPVVIENQTGAAGSIGVARVAKAEPDGYTLIVISSTFTINAVLQSKQSFDPRRASRRSPWSEGRRCCSPPRRPFR
jgi:tripartite-type tricarboxylate transporter receptor subunit TctC